MKKTLRIKLLVWFLVFSSLTFVSVVAFNSLYFKKKANITILVGKINEFQVRILKTFILLDEFLALETSSEDFFHSRESEYLDIFHDNINWTYEESDRLIKQSHEYNLDVEENLIMLQKAISEYQQTFNNMLDLIYKRGFKDYGLEGAMRNYVHILENFTELDQAKVLSLRRHEKDYIIRNEQQYIEKLNNLGTVIRKDVLGSPRLSNLEKDSIINIIDKYVTLFNNLVNLDRGIGIKDNSSGYKLALNKLTENIEFQFSVMMQKAESNRAIIFSQLEVLYIFFYILLILVSFILSYSISKRITAPLSHLTTYITRMIDNNFKNTKALKLEKSHYEIEVLNKEFCLMINLLHEREKERNNAESALRKSELRYRELAEMLPLSIYETDLSGKFTYVNKTWLKQFNYNHEDLSCGIELKNSIVVDNPHVFTEKNEYGNECIVKTKNGTTFPALVYSDRIMDGNQTIGHRGILLDITERRKYIEELKREKFKAEESDRLKSAFLANMSHEIRTPMNAIIGFSDLLSKLNPTSSERTEFIKHIKNSGNILINLIDDIIDIAKIEAEELKINYSPTNINQILNELMVSYSEHLKRENKENVLDLIVNKPIGGNDFYINSDPFRLKQILSNLIGNAIKFTDFGFVEFGYNLKNDLLEFYVRDTGIGLSKENQKLIFDRFRQVEDTHTRKYGGTGLGLSISQNLVQLLGGKIWVESELGKGTTFYFTIEKWVLPSTIQNVTLPEVSDSDFDWHSYSLLIVEDDMANAALLREGLKETGIKMHWVHNGREAIEICTTDNDINVVLMDIQMPVMNGYEATQRIKEKCPDLPIIAQTAYAMAGKREQALEAGCDDYISKPINLLLLKRKICTAIQASKYNCNDPEHEIALKNQAN